MGRYSTGIVAHVAQIAASVSEVGLLSPIILRRDRTLIAGLHRLKAFKLLGRTEISARILDDDDTELAEVDENLMREDLSVLEQSEHLLRREQILHARGIRATVGRDRRTRKGAPSAPLVTTQDMATTVGLSKRATQERMQVARRIVEPARDLLRDTQVAHSTKDLLRISRLKPEVQLAVAEKLAQGASTVRVATTEVTRDGMAGVPSLPPSGDRYQVYCCDIAELPDLVGPETIDAVVCDPPYGDLDSFSKLGEVAAQILKPHGTLFAMSGLYHLPEVLDRLREHLDYHWVICYSRGDASQMIFPRNLATKWKPIVWFQKGSYEGPHVVDRVQGDGSDKTHHEWGQDVAGTQRLIEMVTRPGDIVVDPYLGGGSAALATLRAGRYFIGSDVDETCVTTTLHRIETELR